jgi:hypothetical protein
MHSISTYIVLVFEGEVKTNNSIKTMMGEMSAKTTFKRSAKGPVQISLCAPDGSYLQLHNTGSKVTNSTCFALQ